MVRTALTIADPQLAHQLATGLRPRHPIAEHALVTVNASLAEARGELDTAADGYRDAAQRWQQFGMTPEHAHALLGHGRCLTALGQPAQATQALNTPVRSTRPSTPPPPSPKSTRCCTKPTRSPPSTRSTVDDLPHASQRSARRAGWFHRRGT